jgi:hypothetical protein
MIFPDKMHILYDNGYRVPLILGLGNNEYKFELRSPEYSKNDDGTIVIRI